MNGETRPNNLAAIALMEGDIECMLICYRKKNGGIRIDYDGGALMALGLATCAKSVIESDIRANLEDDDG